MAKNTSDVIDDSRTYAHHQIAAIIGRSERWTKEFIRDHVAYADLGNGLFMVSGRLWRLAIERLSESPEQAT
jgi:hypothetical protein